MDDNFQFDIISNYLGYLSSKDKTNVNPAVLIRGSKNVYKKLSGTIAARPGLLLRGSTDNTNAGVKSSYEWYSSIGRVYPLRVANGNLQFESDIVTPGTFVWYTIMTGLTVPTSRMVFDTWWNVGLKKDTLLFVNHTSNMNSWSGGFTIIASTTSTTITKAGTTTWAQDGFDSTVFAPWSDQTTEFNITNPTGSTFRYTYDGTGTDPTINATTMPVGSYVVVSGTNFNAANNGFFIVTGSGPNYFEVTNASGVVESTKTLGVAGTIAMNFKKVMTINGGTYAYEFAEGTTTLTSVLALAGSTAVGSIPAGALAIQNVIVDTNIPSSTFTADFLKVINNRVHIGSYTSNLCYISQNINFLNYVVPTPRQTGDPELLTLDNPLKGITAQSGNAQISAGLSDWYSVTYTSVTVDPTLTENTNVDKLPTSDLSAAYAHEFIDNMGDNIIYLSQDQQIRVYGTFRNFTTPKFPSISQEVQQEFTDENFTGGHLRCVGDFIYITAPANGRDWMYQERQTVNEAGNIIAERIWHPPQVRNVSRIAVINSVVFGHSSANPQIYQLWDTLQWHDDSPSGQPLPYTCVAKFAYKQLPQKGGSRRQGKAKFDKIYTEGYMPQGVNLYCNVYLDYQGATDLQQKIINAIATISAPATPAVFYSGQEPPTLGSDSLGDNPIGDGLVLDPNFQELTPKFRSIDKVTAKPCFEWNLEYYSIDLDCQWEIVAHGDNAILSPTQSPEITK